MLFKAPLFTNKKGFTLVELMVGMVVAVMVMGMTYAIFTSQLRLTKTEMSINDLQLNTQTALRYLSKKMRNLGFGVTTKVPVPVLLWYDGDQGSSGSGSGTLSIWPQNQLPYSDAVAFFSSNEPKEVKVINYDSSNKTATLKSQLDQTNDIGKLVLFYDSLNQYYKTARIESITPNGSNSDITFSFGWGGNAPAGYDFKGAPANILSDFNMIYVDNNNVLRMKTFTSNGIENIPLMNNVLSLQISVGVDTDNDNIVDNWTYNESDLSSLYEVKALKIFIVTATSSEEKGVSMSIMDRINQLAQNAGGIWNDEVDWSTVISHFAQVHGTDPGVPRVYSFGCELRNVFTCN